MIFEKSLDERLNSIRPVIEDREFRKDTGYFGTLPSYIFAYPADEEIKVRKYVSRLRDNICEENLDFKVVLFDLFDLFIQTLKENDDLENVLELESEDGSKEIVDVLSGSFGTFDKSNPIYSIIEGAIAKEDDAVLFLTGIGKCYPVLRAHNVLSNLSNNLRLKNGKSLPVVIFYPGTCSSNNRELKLFGSINDIHNYKAQIFPEPRLTNDN